MPERTNRCPWVLSVGAVVVITGGVVVPSGVPDVLADEGKPKVVTVPDIPEILRQADWVHEQRAQEQARLADPQGALEAAPAPAGPVAVEGAPPEPASAPQAAAAPAPVAKKPAPKPAAEPAAGPDAESSEASAGTGSDSAGLAAGGGAPKPAAPAAKEPAAPSDGPGARAPAEGSTKATSTTAPSGLEPPYDLEIKATARQVWVWISVDDGPQQAVSLDRGESARFEARERYVLTVDDAGGVEASLNGRELPSFGGKAQAKRDLVIPSPDLEPVG